MNLCPKATAIRGQLDRTSKDVDRSAEYAAAGESGRSIVVASAARTDRRWVARALEGHVRRCQECS